MYKKITIIDKYQRSCWINSFWIIFVPKQTILLSI